MRIAALLALVGLATFTVACGQKGPLVLPDAQHPHKKIGAAKPATSSAPPPTPQSGPTPADPTASSSPGQPSPARNAPGTAQPMRPESDESGTDPAKPSPAPPQ